MGSMNKETLNDIIFRRMALLISSCWFFITNSVIFLISLIARQVFRIFKIEDSSQEDDSDVSAMESRCRELVRIFTELEEKDSDLFQDKETSSFSFKFQYQISEDQRGGNEEPVAPIPQKEEPMIPAAEGKEPSITTSISKYRFLSEKDFSGFVQEPEVKTFRVEESYIGSETDYLYDKDTVDNRLDASLLSAKDFHQPSVEDVNIANLNKQGEFKDAISIKNKSMEKEKAVRYETSSPVKKEAGSLSAKKFEEPSGEDVSTDSLNARRKIGRSEHAILIKRKHLEKKKAINYETSSLGEKEVGVLSGKNFQVPSVEDVCTDSLNAIRKQGKSEGGILIKDKMLKKEKAINSETSSLGENDVAFLSGKGFQEPGAKDVCTDSLNAIRKLGKSEDGILIQDKMLKKEKAINSEISSLAEKDVAFLSEKNFQEPSAKDDSTDSLNAMRQPGKSEDGIWIQKRMLKKEKAINSDTSSWGEKDLAFLTEKNSQELSAKDVCADSLNAIRKLGKLEDGTLIKNKMLRKEKAINYNKEVPYHKKSNKEVGLLSARKIRERSMKYVSTHSPSAIKKQGKSEDGISVKNKVLEKEMAIDSETSSLDEKQEMDGAKFLSEDFCGFDIDSESLSSSDGYSVKDLIVDSDSEGFLSERDFIGHEHGSDTTEASMNTNRYKAELLEDIRKLEEAQLQFNYTTDAESTDSGGYFPYIENRINFEDIESYDIWSESELSKPESEQNEMNEDEVESRRVVQQIRERMWASSNASHREFTDSSDDELCSSKNTGSYRKSSDEVLSVSDSVNPETILEDLDGKKAENPATTCNFEKTKSESSNTRCDASISSPLRTIHDAEQQDSAELTREVDEPVQPSELGSEKKSPENDAKKSGENNLKYSYDEDLDDEDFDELESLWEHQDLIEQLKMELKKARATGLPTILEESESPKTVEDLKPWKIDEQFLHEDPMDELHKFYKSYRERMRKFDILNYQKMYAIGFLQLKDPLQSMGSQKPLISTVTSIISQSFMPCRQKSNADPSEKFIKELRDDLETVYVGQTCLSWEFLRWQYEKARELPESDPYRSHQYNQVAGEFQQFQVMVQRFIENETFQGPRLPNYVKNRCVIQNLLRVPVIKEDCLKDKMEEQRKGNDAITSEILEDIMEESIRLFWEFVKADKDETPVILKGLLRTQVELQDPSDYELMMHIHAILQKKEKKLKDILRTGNCLVKKFKKPKEDRSNQDLFFSQVDMKLVARVLKMSRITTDQLVWCHKKLNKINFVDRKILREPAFLLFPC
ncbi:uncharacterized protein [Elaeis guineensis]|uniref:Uncharacterized protein LOC105056586 n=1 Tax=Elaeis guineensis var. tenera TaxID=51953 RepID=A0A6I9S3K0_ELAGV|nr:uncharacterized protein LOC105056586 [Elaeis guineensis]XP_029123814.1 uncharacterized protein LOC105056586 [Elaeis guineensis]